MQLGVDFREGGKPENPEKNPRSTREINYDNSIHMSPSTDPHPTGLNLELSGERQRANRVRHPYYYIKYNII